MPVRADDYGVGFNNDTRQPMASISPAAAISSLPTTGYVRQAQFIPHIIPVSAATWWRWVNSGKAPKPVKLSERVTAWRAEDLRAFIDAQGVA